ncbi:MAG: CoA transferase [Sulfobacillus thermotolerans]|nr:CoA transferase [Sulfobacillus thermotolerans]
MPEALADLVVLDLTRILTGPFCTMMLADFGATVYKIEPPGGDDTRQWGPPFIHGESAYFLSVNRNKKSIVVDLKSLEGQRMFRQMAAQADVVVENYRPGTLRQWGLDYPSLSAINPRLIMASISGFGATGPGRQRPGYDLIAQAMSGFMATTGSSEQPPIKAGFSIADIGAGMWAAYGIMVALHARSYTGRGQWIDTSLYESMIAWQTYQASNFFATGEEPEPLGSAHPNIAPYQALHAQDGFLVVACGNDHLWQRLVKACDIPFGNDPRFRTNPERVVHRELLIKRLEEIFERHPVRHWLAILEEAGVPAGPIQHFADVFNDPQVQLREMVQTISHPIAGPIKMTGIPLKLSETPGRITLPPPRLDEHREEILRRFGLYEK